MINSKAYGHRTKAEDEREKELHRQLAQMHADLAEGLDVDLEAESQMQGELSAIHNAAVGRYIDRTSPAQALNDARDILRDMTKEDYAGNVKMYADLFGTDTPYKDMQLRVRSCPEGALSFIRGTLYLQQSATAKAGTGKGTLFDKLQKLMTEKVEEWFPHVQGRPIKSVEYPLDKVNFTIWQSHEKLLSQNEEEEGGEEEREEAINEEGDEESANEEIQEKRVEEICIRAERSGSKREATITVLFDFSALENDERLRGFLKELTAFDKDVYIACNAIYQQDGHYTTFAKIHETMGGNGNPSRAQIKRIKDSILKMMRIILSVDNSDEVLVNKGYPLFSYSSSLLPCEIGEIFYNNNFVRDGIHFFREPPLMSFAKGRGQITNIPVALLRNPLDKTEGTLRLQHYLISRIAQMKRPGSKLSRKILYSTLYEYCDISVKQRGRTLDKTQKLLEHYKKCKWISSYHAEEDGVSITLKGAKRSAK